MSYIGLFKASQKSISISIPRETKIILFWDSQSYPSYGFVYAYTIELDNNGNGTPRGRFEINDIKVINWTLTTNFIGGSDNALLVFGLN